MTVPVGPVTRTGVGDPLVRHPDRVGLTPLAYAERMALPQLAAVAVTMVLLWYAW